MFIDKILKEIEDGKAIVEKGIKSIIENNENQTQSNINFQKTKPFSNNYAEIALSVDFHRKCLENDKFTEKFYTTDKKFLKNDSKKRVFTANSRTNLNKSKLKNEQLLFKVNFLFYKIFFFFYLIHISSKDFY